MSVRNYFLTGTITTISRTTAAMETVSTERNPDATTMTITPEITGQTTEGTTETTAEATTPEGQKCLCPEIDPWDVEDGELECEPSSLEFPSYWDAGAKCHYKCPTGCVRG